jgi:hypothetical protein
MHYNLLFNGCSYTNGSELQGKENDFEYLRLHRFSHVISEKMNKTYENIALGGNSNERIVRTTIEWFESGNTCDLAIIQFTLMSRYEFISRHAAHPVNFAPGANIPLMWETEGKIDNKKDYNDAKDAYENYYKYVYNDNLGLYNFYKNLFILEQYLEKNNIPYYFIKLAGDRAWLDSPQKNVYWRNCCKHTYSSIPAINGTILDLEDKSNFTIDYSKDGRPALNGKHPSELGHQKIADYIIKHYAYPVQR